MKVRVLKAFAKLNLGLRVLYRRPDGYHELRTVFQTISLADHLEIELHTRSRQPDRCRGYAGNRGQPGGTRVASDS